MLGLGYTRHLCGDDPLMLQVDILINNPLLLLVYFEVLIRLNYHKSSQPNRDCHCIVLALKYKEYKRTQLEHIQIIKLNKVVSVTVLS